METVFFVLGNIAAVLVIIAVPVLTARAMILMARMEETRKNLAALIAEGTLSLQHAGRVMARSQEGIDRLRHAMDHIERVITLLQPATAVGGLLSGARRVLSGGRKPAESSNQITEKENGHD